MDNPNRYVIFQCVNVLIVMLVLCYHTHIQPASVDISGISWVALAGGSRWNSLSCELCWLFLTGFLCCSGNSVEELLDAENRRLAENLTSKVSRLKSVSDSFCDLSDFTLRRIWRRGNVCFCCLPTADWSLSCDSLRLKSTERQKIRTIIWTTWWGTSASGICPSLTVCWWLTLLLGLQLPECDRSADRQREAFFHHGSVREGQPPDSVLRVHGAGPGLLPALLPDLQDTAVTSDFCFAQRRGGGERNLHEEPTGRTNLLWLAADTWTYGCLSQLNFCFYHIITQTFLKRLLLTGWRTGAAPAGVADSSISRRGLFIY